MKGTVGPAILKIDPDLAKRFRRVCPHWAKYILELPSNTKTFPKNFRADSRDWYIVNGDTCIVGDAYACNTAYRKKGSRGVCGTCTRLSFELMNFNEYGANDWEQTWNESLSRFLDHFEEAHVK